MNYNGNMPDWHQYNSTQSGINDVTASAQNINTGHLPFISSINTTQVNSLNLNSDRLEKHHNDSNFNPRHFQAHLSNNISHGHNVTDNTPLASMVQMQNCIGPYGSSNTRNALVDNLNGPMDPRNTAIGSLNEELSYRNNQVPFNGPITHLNGPSTMNMNGPHGSVGLRNTNVNSHSTNRAGPSSYVPCKGLCCNPDPNIGYQQWEKYPYQNNTTYRENVRPSGYQTDTRRFGSDFNFRKDNFDGKEILSPIVPNAPNTDHRRNFSDFKYRKDRLLSRNYPSSSGMLQNYPMQNYNYTGEYQKYPYNVKDYPKLNSMNIPNQGVVKHQEQSFISQQKYNNKQPPYQNSGMISSSISSTNVNPNMISSTQTTYFNPQYSRNLPTETSHDCQEAANNASMVNRMQTSTMHASHSRYQVYQQKIAMQRYSMENQLREFTRMSDYQSHPKYKECVLRYREIVKLQQSVSYPGQIQQSPCVTAPPVNTSVPPINLQFDQNGVLINSNYIPEAFPRIQQVLNSQASVDTSDKLNKQENNNISEIMSHNLQKTEQMSQTHDTAALCAENLQKQERYAVQKSLNQNQFAVQKTGHESFNNLDTTASNTTIEQKISKQFADKPELDVRQFLANWDESEDEDGANSNLPNVILNNSTPVVVVGYENIDLSTKTLENLESAKLEDIPSSVIAFENQDKNNATVTSAQNCLTVSYSSAENIEIAKDSCKEIAKESIVQPRSIIQCISNGPDEIPTIHIVDNLEIGSILQVTNGQVAGTLEGQDAVSLFHEKTEVEASAIALETDKKTDSREPNIKYNADLKNLSKKEYVVGSSRPSTTMENTSQTNDQEINLSTSTKSNTESTQDINLKKQSSFTSEESHNPDDISLPDLPTSECTPISTTLNTPIHSDSEESSERVEDLTISTNPIEIIQNSPMISFTQSPIKGEPYDHLNDEGIVKNKSANTSEVQYQTEKHYKDDCSNSMLEHNTVLNTFEFSTNIDKNAPTITKKSSEERSNSSRNSTSANIEKVFSLDSKTENVEGTGMCMTLTSGEYELKIVSTGIQSKPTRDYKNSTTTYRINESQTDVKQDEQTVHKKLQTFQETDVTPALQYSESIEFDNALRNRTNNTNSVEYNSEKTDINYVDTYETSSPKTSKNVGKLCAILSANEKKRITTESNVTMNASIINSSNDITSKNSKAMGEDSSPTDSVKVNPSTSHSTKCSALNNNLRKNQSLTDDKSGKQDSVLEKNANANKSIKIDVKDSKSTQCMKLTDYKKSIPNNLVTLRRSETFASHKSSGKERCLSQSTKNCSETIVHHNKYIEEFSDEKLCDEFIKSNKQLIGDINRKECNRIVGGKRKLLPTGIDSTTYEDKSVIEGSKQSNNLQKERKTINNDTDESRERMRLLKEYRRTKYKSSSVGEIQNKNRGTREISTHKTSKNSHTLSNINEKSVPESISDIQLCQKETKLKSSEEQEKSNAVLKTFITKKTNMNSDFAIQVTNVNFKLKDKDHQKEPQHLREETKNGTPLDAIKIEINVSCTERNTTEKLLHENIKNAVAETIGHLTSSISNGARSNTTNLIGSQCDNKITCDRVDPPDYEQRSSPASTELSTYNEIIEDQRNIETTKHKSVITACKKGISNDEASTSLISKNRRNSSSERDLITDIHEDNGTSSKILVNTCAEESPTSDAATSRDNILLSNINMEDDSVTSALDISKSAHVTIRSKNVYQDTETKIIATDVCANPEELKASSDNSSYVESTPKNTKKKGQRELIATSLCKNSKNLQNNIASTRLNIGPSTSSNTKNSNFENSNYDNSTYLDYNHFDVAPIEHVDTDDRRIDKWKRSNREDNRFSRLNLYENASGYINPIFFNVDELENLNAVPVYTTKDGKITYSPNPRFTYRELIMEARTKESYVNTREYFVRSPSFDYYNCSKLRKISKKNSDIITTKRETDSANSKSQFTKHVHYLSNKNATHKNNHCVKNRSILHLEFFNNDADKLYTNKSSQQESNEDNKRNIIDLNFLEKQYNLDNKPMCDSKQCKTKALEDEVNYEKEYNENFMFDSDLFLGPKTTCWEETMESVKSYSSHVDRRKNNNFNELNFSEMFAAQKQLNSFSFLPAKQDTSNGNNNQRINNNNESILPYTTCSHSDRHHLIRDNNLQSEQLNTTPYNEQENENVGQGEMAVANVHIKSASMDNLKKQESQQDETESNAIISTEAAKSHSPQKIKEEIQCPADNIKKIVTEHVANDDIYVHCTVPIDQDKCDTEKESVKEVSNNLVELMNPSKSDVDSKNSPAKPNFIEAIEEFDVVLDECKINDTAINCSHFPLNNKIVDGQISPGPVDSVDKIKEKVLSAVDSSEIYSNGTNYQNDTDNRKNFTACKEKGSLQHSPDIAFADQSLDAENNIKKLRKNEAQVARDSYEDLGNDEIDNCSFTTISEQATILDLQFGRSEETECDLFTKGKSEQNISEFSIIKNIINSDKEQFREPETKERLKVCDSTIDSKLLCIDSSDCGIDVEDRCSLTQMAEHDFTEDDSMVPMKWETNEIQEDAVNRLCSIDESSIGFVGAANSLQNNPLLENLALSIIKKSQVSEAISEIEIKTNEPRSIVESVPVIDRSKTATSNDEKKEQSQVSSDGYEKIAYLHAADYNANTRIVPKLVIKKTEVSSKFVTKIASSSSVTQMDDITNKSISIQPSSRPKIPKMIIRNARSRPGTPSIEAIPEKDSAQTDISDRGLLTIHNDTSEEVHENDSESSLQELMGYKNKIPKMRIKLDEKHSNKIIRTEDVTEFCVTRKSMKKTMPKMKIKNSLKAELSDNAICNNTTFQELKELPRYEEKIPILKLKKQERNRSSSPEVMRKRPNLCYSEVPIKKYKKLGRDEARHLIKHNESNPVRTIMPECETNKKNTLVCISEKIPKVIIKRTSANAEFKCELSKSCKDVITKSARWQPKVKLERYRILDSMVKDLKLTVSPMSLRNIDKIFTNRMKDDYYKKEEGDHDRRKLFRSSSTSDLLPTKCKQRRMSDYDCRITSGTIRDDLNLTPLQSVYSSDNKICITPKNNVSSKGYSKLPNECRKDNKCRSRSCDNNQQVEDGITLSDKETNQSTVKESTPKKVSPRHNECKINNFDVNHESTIMIEDISMKLSHSDISIEYPESADFKTALNGLKETSKMDTRFPKCSSVHSLSRVSREEIDMETDKEREDDPLLHKTDDEIINVKKEQLIKSPEDIDSNSVLQNDIGSLKEDAMIVLDNFEIDNSVIKIESSDESQTTIEILPASPDEHNELENHMDGDNEQLYPADAIPTQFELELEITDNSNIDLLDVPMPKLDPVACYSSRRVSTGEYYSDEASKTGCSDQSEPLFNIKNLLGKAKHMGIGISNDNKPVLENSSANAIEKISSKSQCGRSASFTETKENFCCNDSLIKEVLAAKEALKKCLSKTRYEENNAANNSRPKTAAEKKQGLSFDINSFSEVHSKPQKVSQVCPCDFTQKNSNPIIGKHNKTEITSNPEKSEEKHSKHNEHLFVKKMRSPEKRDKILCPTPTFADIKESIGKIEKDTHDCTTISLKQFKQSGQTSNKNITCTTVHLSQKRKKDLADQYNVVSQLQESQQKGESNLSSYKIPKISKSIDQESNINSNVKEIKSKEDNMPILEPEIALSYDVSSNSRDSSRSPPVITNQDSADLNLTESKQIRNKIITSEDQAERDIKDHQKDEITIADFITQLAYHEKATIKHKRYCNLCEKWFPTTSRHRRHLAGYQHRHIELTQRRSIHALFMLFTGKPCPKLLPANVVRSDCSVGELTPLQIAIQDVTKCFDCTHQSLMK